LTQACERSPALGRVAEQAAGFRQRDLDRQRRRAVAVRKFRGEQRVADQKRRLHRAGRHIKRLGQRALGNEHDGHDRRELHGLRTPTHRLGWGNFLLVADHFSVAH